MSTSITKGPAFEIRFCEGNKVQVFDLSKRGDQSGNQLLPNEYSEDDVVNGRLRYSKLGNQWLPDDQHHQQTFAAIPDDQNHATTTKKPDDNLNLIPVVAKRKAIEDAKELESIRQGEEAMRKAMERKKKIEMLRRARQQAEAAKAEASSAQPDNHIQDNSASMNDDKDVKNESTNEQDPHHHSEHGKDLTFATETNREGRSAKTNQDSTSMQDTDHLTASPVSEGPEHTAGSSLRDSGTSIHIDRKGKVPYAAEKAPSFAIYESPVPPRTTSSSPVQQPVPVLHQQSSTHHYYPQQQPQQHEYTGHSNQVRYEVPLEDSFFHQDNSGDKNKPPSSSCCCIIS